MNELASRPVSGHEPQSLSTKRVCAIIGGVFGGLFALSLISLPIWRGLFEYAENKAAAAIPPPPRLQARPLPDYQRYEAHKQQQLDTYAWDDRNQGVARIPVSVAMRTMSSHKHDTAQGGVE